MPQSTDIPTPGTSADVLLPSRTAQDAIDAYCLEKDGDVYWASIAEMGQSPRPFGVLARGGLDLITLDALALFVRAEATASPIYVRVPELAVEWRTALLSTTPEVEQFVGELGPLRTPSHESFPLKVFAGMVLDSPPPWPHVPLDARAAKLPVLAPPDAFPDGTGRIPNNPAVHATLSAIWKGGRGALKKSRGWIMPPGAFQPVYEHHGDRGGKITVYVSPPSDPYGPAPTAEMMLTLVESLDPFHGDILLAMLAQLCEPTAGDRPKAPLLEPVLITAESIARYKGIQRWGVDRRTLLKEIHDRIEALRQVHFDVHGYWAHDPAKDGRWGKVTWEGDQVVNIIRERSIQLTIDGREEEVETAWRVRAGMWAAAWLNPATRVYIGRMARALLELPSSGAGARPLAKKLGQRFLLLRGALDTPPGPLIIANLLESIGELPQPSERPKDWAGRTRQALEDALLSFQEAGFIAYTKWPDEIGGPEDTYRGRGWVERWLPSHVLIVLTDDVPNIPALEQQPRRIASKPATKTIEHSPLDSTAIRQTREALYWTQETLAETLSISRVYLSGIESGKRQPSPALNKRIREWMATAREEIRQRDG